MEMIDVVYFTDPLCPWSWAAEPALRRLETEFGDQLRIAFVMVGMAREVDTAHELAETLDAIDASGMPADPRVWIEGSPRSSYPACLAVKAAAEQGLDGPYLRRLRLGLMTGRERIDNPEAFLAAAREVAGLDVARFDIDMRSNAIVEAFGSDRERADAAGHTPQAGRGAERPGIPAFAFGDGAPVETSEVDALREAAVAAGARPGADLPDPEAAVRRFGPVGAAEVAAACGLPGPRAQMELWRLAGEWRVRPRALVCGELWGPA
jgi:predicted DsbA family dithiol-disulfide isomerase